MAKNARKHEVPSGTDTTVSRATIFTTALESVRDIIPVAGLTERAQIVSGLTANSQGPAADRPLAVTRSDAPGLHRNELTLDGSVWIPFSGTLFFGDDTARDSWTSSNVALLTSGDRCVSNTFPGVWNGTRWLQDTAPTKVGTFNEFQHYNDATNGWDGLWFWRTSGWVHITGAMQKTGGSRPSGFIGAAVPPAFAPRKQIDSGQVQVRTSGDIALGSATSNGQAVSFSVSYPQQ